MFPNLTHLLIRQLYNSVVLPTSLTYLDIKYNTWNGNHINIKELTNLQVLHLNADMKIDLNLDDYPNMVDIEVFSCINVSYPNSYPNIKSFKYHKPEVFVNNETFPNLEEFSCFYVTDDSKLEEMSKLTYLKCGSYPERLDLSKFPLLKYFTGQNFLIPEDGMKNIVDMELVDVLESDNVPDEINTEMFPKLRKLKIYKHGYDKEIRIDHDKLESLLGSRVDRIVIRAPNLKYLDLSVDDDRIDFVGNFEKLTKMKISAGDIKIDFGKFENLEKLDVGSNRFNVVGVGKELKGVRFHSGNGVLDLSEFENLEEVMISGVLKDKVILGRNVKNVIFGTPRALEGGYNYEKKRSKSEKYLDLGRCENCKVDDMGIGYDPDDKYAYM